MEKEYKLFGLNRKNIIIGVLVLILVVTLFVYLSSLKNTKKVEEKSETNKTEEVRNRILVPFGESGQLSTLSFKILGVKKSETITGSLFGTTKAKDGAIFLLVNVSAINTTKGTFDFNPMGMLLSNRDGITYDVYQGTSGGVIGMEKETIDGRDLGVNINETGVIVYEIPKDFDYYALEVEKAQTSNTLIFELNDYNVKIEPVKVKYKVIEEENLSYIGCKRVGVRITVPDESNQNDVDYTLKLIAKEYLKKWQDVTIWAWGYSEQSEVGASAYTKGMYEETLNGSCNIKSI